MCTCCRLVGLQVMLNISRRGFTLIEVLIVLALLAVLIAISYPSYAAQARKARRADAVARLAALQQAEENWRADHSTYGSLDDVGVASRTSDSAYHLSVADIGRKGYRAVAEGFGSQADDGPCRFLHLTLIGGNVTRGSGPDESTANDPTTNSRCWTR